MKRFVIEYQLSNYLRLRTHNENALDHEGRNVYKELMSMGMRNTNSEHLISLATLELQSSFYVYQK
jgi:hypothetical protein